MSEEADRGDVKWWEMPESQAAAQTDDLLVVEVEYRSLSFPACQHLQLVAGPSTPDANYMGEFTRY